ncbi:hypothetical protein Pmani_030714 [Petrolisthes manimaculis]|uniref:Uncharacterized protein n=1 Tax=Petrolisthes manimaculis TaxID=1843537 RepID=A0AAE1NX13_9EUCA|nr:hypothetical protein Pmani_030714 [Petrolisthes manimaculis]
MDLCYCRLPTKLLRKGRYSVAKTSNLSIGARKNYKSLSRRGKPIQLANNNNFLCTNSCHTSSEEIEEIHFFWTWQAALIVGMAAAWLLAFLTLACLLRTSVGHSLIDFLCPSILASNNEEEETPEYIIILDGSPGMRRPSPEERSNMEIIAAIMKNDTWKDENMKKNTTNTTNNRNYKDNKHSVIINECVVETPKRNKEKIWNEREVYPTLRTNMKKMENTNLSGSTSKRLINISTGTPVTILRPHDIDISFPHDIIKPSSNVYVSIISESQFPKVERKLSSIKEENPNCNVE